ncbi:LytTR family DNA-binding domain-containing protein [Reichenbachiella carrageenanivorans]|uniref:LytTR family DNA-binding domain-containing protein n=1 Tax=Reichenbachiella carrageenanivorans TaxID=2979869 RepID=A0ABY6D0K3_9BACT|nr:LytTR family DNA-binding domain-containing protein [Reichenbachiella carrageenanivorans]UXX79155.1 LytTR family DNA-binding domain-containing protein [Reichenbachiella carrageenanivorans]
MNILIIEDEGIAADRLTQLLQSTTNSPTIIAHLDSVKTAIKWFQTNPAPDLAFCDIQLADGLSFEIFEQVDVFCPIIFTTAYDQYAIQAFKVNSIDYLLKPMMEEDLRQAMTKFEKYKQPTQSIDTSALMQMLQRDHSNYKERFVIKVGEHLKSVMTEDTEVFYSENKATYLLTKTNSKFIIDFTLDQIQDLIDPKAFFRINRKYLIHINSIKDIISYSSSRLKLELLHFNTDDLIVSRERVAQFKEWLDR